MNNRNILSGIILMAITFCTSIGCTREIDTDELATYPKLSEVFMDNFASDLQFQAWGKVTNFSVDTETKFEGTSSMKIEVPKPDDPMGNWAGGNFYSTMGRDLSDFDALTFYAKSSVPTHMEIGLGNYGETKYYVGIKEVEVNTNWSKIIVPIPNPAKLLAERGLFYYSAGAVDDEGYAIWFDNLQFEKLGTLAHAKIEEKIIPGFPGKIEIGTLVETINLPNGVNCQMEVSSDYFTFESSDTKVASVENGVITIKKSGKAIITPKEAEGKISINSFDLAPVPQRDKSDVISLYSDAYVNEITANWNPRWQYSTAEFNEIDTGGNRIAQYSKLNFVGIVFDETADCSAMTHLHLDVLCMDEISGSSEFKVEIHVLEGEPYNIVHVVKQGSNPDFVANRWMSLDIPLNMGGKHIMQLVLGCDAKTQNVLLDNIYFYKN